MIHVFYISSKSELRGEEGREGKDKTRKHGGAGGGGEIRLIVCLLLKERGGGHTPDASGERVQPGLSRVLATWSVHG